MTRFTVTHSCGHEAFHDIVNGPGWSRAKQAEQRGKGPCPKCWTVEHHAEIESDNATYALLAGDRAFPELDGTLKQQAWANTIRGQFLEQLPGKLTSLNQAGMNRGKSFVAGGQAMALIELLALQQSAAAWWINNRQQIGLALLEVPGVRPALKDAGDAGATAKALLMWMSL